MALTSQEVNQLMDMLKPCPFCGETAVFDVYGYQSAYSVEHKVVKCASCGARMEYDDNTNDGYLVLFNKWNRRAEQ